MNAIKYFSPALLSNYKIWLEINALKDSISFYLPMRDLKSAIKYKETDTLKYEFKYSDGAKQSYTVKKIWANGSFKETVSFSVSKNGDNEPILYGIQIDSNTVNNKRVIREFSCDGYAGYNIYTTGFTLDSITLYDKNRLPYGLHLFGNGNEKFVYYDKETSSFNAKQGGRILDLNLSADISLFRINGWGLYYTALPYIKNRNTALKWFDGAEQENFKERTQKYRK